MGVYAPAPVVSKSMLAEITKNVLEPTVNGMRKEGIPYVGILYAGLILTKDGPSVLEYNCRFGDPEAQVLLPLLSDDVDLAAVMMACINGCLDSVMMSFKKGFAATVVGVSGGYPGTYPKGVPITLPEKLARMSNFFMVHFIVS